MIFLYSLENVTDFVHFQEFKDYFHIYMLIFYISVANVCIIHIFATDNYMINTHTIE